MDKIGKKLNAIWEELRKLPEMFQKSSDALIKASEKIDKQGDELAGIAKNFALIMTESEKGKTITGTVNVENLYQDITKALSENAPAPTEFDYEELAKLINRDEMTLKNVRELATELVKVLPKTPDQVFLAEKKIEVFGKTLVKIEGNTADNPVFVQLSDGKRPIDLKEIFKVSLSVPAGGGGRATPYENNQGMPQFVTLEADSSIPVTVKADVSPAYKLLLDDTSTPNVTYVGKSAIGSATSASAWQIQKIDETSGMSITWAGTGLFTVKWDDRTTESYT